MTQDTKADLSARTDLADGEKEFVEAILAGRDGGEPAESKLSTDDRVIARITDGIYRQPSSALRELISNAYDADATEVVVSTDAPRFREIRVRDNGRGMDEPALARLIYHIGGSSKRTSMGATMGTTDASDPKLSKKGRRLIGKIGIGLFSVSQLTSHFQIITKTKDSDFRLFADVTLKTYSEDDEAAEGPFNSGSVRVTSIPAEDKHTHGTEIILLDVRPRARNILRSLDQWQRLAEQEALPENEREPDLPRPPWHVGFIDPNASSDEATFAVEPNIPWKREHSPLQRFEALFQAVAAQTEFVERPELAKTLDNYLQMLWTLSLAAPVPYLEKHPFDLTSDEALVFHLSNTGRGRAQPLDLSPGQTIRDRLKLKSGADDPVGDFRVFVDQVELRRPISFRFWPGRTDGISKPMVFVGSYRPDLSKVHPDLRGGELTFESYLFWNHKVVPKENNGVLVRIYGSSNATFDDTFMKYQVSEQTRLRQITAEVFVSQGLDAALNIDRESFNFAHPHYQIVSNWVHRALRQFANTHKGLGDEIRAGKNQVKSQARADKLGNFASSTWKKARSGESEPPPDVEILPTAIQAAAARKDGVIALDETRLPKIPPKLRGEKPQRDQITRAIATVLDGFGVLREMPFARQHELISALLAVYFEDAQDG